jgi:sulfur relay (sulfurtransferase) DsrF/TusC family protein
MEFTEKRVLILIRSRPFGTVVNFEGWRAAVGMIGMDHDPTMLLLDDGVYAALEAMDQKPIRLFKSTYESFEGRICVSRESLEQRAIKDEELQEGMQILDDDAIGQVFEDNDIILTF